MNKEEYKKYLFSEHWRKTREERLKLDGYVCSVCKSKFRLQVHHLTYANLHNEDVFKDLITLCEGCHKNEHFGYVWAKSSKKLLKKNKKRKKKIGQIHLDYRVEKLDYDKNERKRKKRLDKYKEMERKEKEFAEIKARFKEKLKK